MVTEVDQKELKREAIVQLKAAMVKIPFNLQTAGATRVDAFKHAVHEAEKLLNRNPPEPWKYVEAKRKIEATGVLSPEGCMRQTLGQNTGGLQ